MEISKYQTHHSSFISHNSNNPIFFFDGVCNLCNGAVDFIIRHENSSEILFASIQSTEAQHFLKKMGKDLEKLDTLYFYTKNILFEKAEASLQIAQFLNKPWSYLSIFKYLPKSFLNSLYDYISKNRYRFFGKRESCRLPTNEEKPRFLD